MNKEQMAQQFNGYRYQPRYRVAFRNQYGQRVRESGWGVYDTQRREWVTGDQTYGGRYGSLQAIDIARSYNRDEYGTGE